MTNSAEMIEPEVRNLTEETLRILRHNLAEIRRLTGIGELVTLGRLISQLGMQERTEGTADPRLVKAIERGAAARQKLQDAEGGSLSADEAAKTLGMSKVALLKRYKKGRLIAWRGERQKAFRLPSWQFQNNQVLPGLEKVLTKLNEGVRLDDYGRMLFFLSNMGFLGGKRPLDCLREGDLPKAVQAAQGYGQQ